MAEKNFKDVLNEIDSSPSTPGKTLRAFRKNFGITLKDLEEVTGVTESNLLYKNLKQIKLVAISVASR
jgi:hypothetical protein